jgi:murein DD-endopeptidase MepM/ murein hydrolase activator NlpD
MASFNFKIGSPVRGSFKGSNGGPNSGGHQPPDWFIQYGNDLTVATGTKIVAAFSGYVRKFEQHVSSKDTEKVYGAQLFMRSNNNKLGVFYTHFTRCPGFNVNQRINRGDVLGYSLRDHLHFAMVEIIGGRPGDMPTSSYMGVDLHQKFLDLRDSENVMSVKFSQDRKQPTVISLASDVDTSWLNGWWKVSDGKDYFYYFSRDTVQYTTTKPTSNNPPLRPDNIGYYSYTLGELVINWTQKTGTVSENVETFSNASPGCAQMNGTSNLYGGPLEAKRDLD